MDRIWKSLKLEFTERAIYTFSNENKQVKINSDYKNVEHIFMVGSKKATLQKTLHKFTLFVNHKKKILIGFQEQITIMLISWVESQITMIWVLDSLFTFSWMNYGINVP